MSTLDASEFYKLAAKAMFGTPRRTRATMMTCKKHGDTPRALMHDIWIKVNAYPLRGYKPSTFIFNHVQWMFAERESNDAMQRASHVQIDDSHTYDEQTIEGTEQHFQRKSIDDALRYLKKRERLVLKLSFGLYGGGERTTTEISSILKVSRSRVQQIEARAIDKLRDKRMLPILGRYKQPSGDSR